MLQIVLSYEIFNNMRLNKTWLITCFSLLFVFIVVLERQIQKQKREAPPFSMFSNPSYIALPSPKLHPTTVLSSKFSLPTTQTNQCQVQDFEGKLRSVEQNVFSFTNQMMVFWLQQVLIIIWGL